VVGHLFYYVPTHLTSPPEVTGVPKDLVCHPHLHEGTAGERPVVVGDDLHVVLNLEERLQAQEFSCPGDPKLALVVGDVAGQFAPLRLLRSKPLQSELLPVISPHLYTLIGENVIGLPDVAPVVWGHADGRRP
jgi:hypothetical protein